MGGGTTGWDYLFCWSLSSLVLSASVFGLPAISFDSWVACMFCSVIIFGSLWDSLLGYIYFRAGWLGPARVTTKGPVS